MDFTLNMEQQLLQDSVRRFVERASTPGKPAALAAAGGGQAGLWHELAGNGWLGVSIPEHDGGFGGSAIEMSLVAHELGRGLITAPYLGCGVLGAQTLLACAASAARDGLLPSLIDGSRRLSLAYGDVQSCGMLAPAVMRAERSSGGYVLDGVKTLVLGAPEADFHLVSAAVCGLPEGGGTTLFLVSAQAAGLTCAPLPLHDGRWAAELTFDQVVVPESMVLTEPGEGMPPLVHGMVHGIAASCAELVGAMERAIEITAEYLRVRKQFGVAIASFQSLQHRMADMVAEMELSRSMLHALLAAMRGGDTARARLLASQAKALVARAARQVCGQAIQLHGGIGMTTEYAVGNYYRRAVVGDALLGSADRHEAFCADALQL